MTSLLDINSLPTSIVCSVLITFANSLEQIRPNKTSGLIWIQTIWHSDGILKKLILKKSTDDKNACKTTEQAKS